MGVLRKMGEQLMKNYYAKFKGKCYAFNNKGSPDTAVNEFGFEKLTKSQALHQFGYTDSCSQRVVRCAAVPCSTPLELRNTLSEVTK